MFDTGEVDEPTRFSLQNGEANGSMTELLCA
jgi:hypothetical protein